MLNAAFSTRRGRGALSTLGSGPNGFWARHVVWGPWGGGTWRGTLVPSSLPRACRRFAVAHGVARIYAPAP
eukprot:5339603-Prymnesium_polylepis.1